MFVRRRCVYPAKHGRRSQRYKRQLAGGAYAYYGLNPSAAIEFSPENTLFYNPGSPGTGFYTDGKTPQDGGAPLKGTGPVSLASHDPISVIVSFYGGGTGIGDLQETLTDETTLATFTLDYGVVDLESIVGGPTAFIGFSGATGAGVSTQTISDFSMAPVPEASSLALLATVIGGCFGFRRMVRR